MNKDRAQKLIRNGIATLINKGRLLSRPEDGRYYAMLIELIEGGPSFRLIFSKLSAAEVSKFSGGEVTAAQVEASLQNRGHFPVLSAVADGEDIYSEVTEMRVDDRKAPPSASGLN